MPTILPPDISAVLDALGVCGVSLRPAQTQADRDHLTAVRTGISAQWRPTPGDTEPPH